MKNEYNLIKINMLFDQTLVFKIKQMKDGKLCYKVIHLEHFYFLCTYFIIRGK